MNRHWFVLRPGMSTDIRMMSDEEMVPLVRQIFLWAEEPSEAQVLEQLKGVFVGDWISVRDGIAIRLRDGLFNSKQVSS